MRNTQIRSLVILITLIVVAICLQVFLSTPPLIKLGNAPPLAGQVAQSLQSGGQTGALPIPDKDFTISDIHYFSDRSWAVVSFKPTNNQNLDGGIVVLQKKSAIFRVVLGPTSSLPSDYAVDLPNDVSAYLYNQGIFH